MLKPNSEADLADIIRNSKGRLAIQGGGTRGIVSDGEALTTRGLNGIVTYEPGALTMVAKTGTSLDQIKTKLDAEGQILPFEPYIMNALTGAQGQSTIGGVFATNTSGPRRIQAGAARDFLLGTRFVDGSGAIIKNGGRVMKNVTGYDLTKLNAGAYGTLGVMTEVSFKVLPKPETSATLQLDGLSDDDALHVLTRALNTPFDISGVAHIAQSGTSYIRVEGFEGSVAHRVRGLKDALKDVQDITVCEGNPWARFETLDLFGGPIDALWKVAVKATDAARFAQHAPECKAVYDWAGGRIWLGLPKDASNTASRIKARHIALQKVCTKETGHVTLMHSSETLHVARFQPEAPAVAALSQGIRTKFDPCGYLNPGLMGTAS